MKKISMMLNGCFGGFTISNLAFDEYNKRMKAIDPTYVFKPTHKYGYGSEFCSRFDPIMVEIVRQFGKAASAKYSNIMLVDVYEELKDYIEINEYDGMESFTYLFSKYKLDKIKEITESQEDSSIKIEKIKKILDEELEE